MYRSIVKYNINLLVGICSDQFLIKTIDSGNTYFLSLNECKQKVNLLSSNGFAQNHRLEDFVQQSFEFADKPHFLAEEEKDGFKPSPFLTNKPEIP